MASMRLRHIIRCGHDRQTRLEVHDLLQPNSYQILKTTGGARPLKMRPIKNRQADLGPIAGRGGPLLPHHSNAVDISASMTSSMLQPAAE